MLSALYATNTKRSFWRKWASKVMRIQEALRWAISQLRSEDAQADAEILLCHVLQKPRAFLFTWPERPLSEAEQTHFETLLARRIKGEPVAYITGRRAFWNLELATHPSTLIPRADTETLVSAVLETVPEQPLDVVDLGAGTGAIALALASERPHWRVQGIDRLAETVRLAQQNAQHNGLAHVRFAQGDWCLGLVDHSVDVLVSNPPYIRTDDPHLQQGDVRFEPSSALTSGADGLDDIRAIINDAGRVLRAGGWLFLEHGYDQRDDVVLLMIDAGFEHLETRKDLGRQDRVTFGNLPTAIKS